MFASEYSLPENAGLGTALHDSYLGCHTSGNIQSQGLLAAVAEVDGRQLPPQLHVSQVWCVSALDMISVFMEEILYQMLDFSTKVLILDTETLLIPTLNPLPFFSLFHCRMLKTKCFCLGGNFMHVIAQLYADLR